MTEAEARLDTLARKRELETGVTYSKAYAEVLDTNEGRELYKQHRGSVPPRVRSQTFREKSGRPDVEKQHVTVQLKDSGLRYADPKLGRFAFGLAEGEVDEATAYAFIRDQGKGRIIESFYVTPAKLAVMGLPENALPAGSWWVSTAA